MQPVKKKSQNSPKQARKKKRSLVFRLFKWMLIMGLFLVVVGLAGAAGLYYHLSRDLPKISKLADYRPAVITSVYSDDGRKIAEFFKERRIVIPISDMSDMVLKAFIAAEDSRFFKHRGIDIASIVRAFIKNLEAGQIVQGGSTITQQVTKSFLLSPERSYTRKLKEAILAYRIDRAFTKEEILFLYLNQIYLGHGAYGVEAAAENYFGKSARELSLAECAVLAGLPQAPSRYSPYKNPEGARQRQIYVLNRMLDEGYITRDQMLEAIDASLDVHPRRNLYLEQVPSYTEHVRRFIESKYGEAALYTQGLQVYTAVNIDMQHIAQDQIEKGLADLDKRQGYRGPLRKLAAEEIDSFSQSVQAQLQDDPLEEGDIVQAVVTRVDNRSKRVTVHMGGATGEIALEDMQWARKPDPEVAYYQARVKRPGDVLAVGDVILVRLKGKQKDGDGWQLVLEQIPIAQSALLCIETQSGHVKAMVGGRDFRETQFNRATQSRRQPGSAFKPIIYAAALDKQVDDPTKAYTPATVIIDSPIVYEDRDRDFTWKPKNYKERFFGPTLLRDALAKSRNVVTIKILQGIGIDYAIQYATNLGITSELSRDLSIALGSSGVSLLELVNAYSVFANQGFHVEPVFVTKILDRQGNVIEEAVPEHKKVIDERTAYLMTHLLEGVINYGTGRRVKALNRPAAGKTGTTNDLHDAWFLGYTPEYVTGVWVGFDEGAPLGKDETGSRAASPIWLGFMQEILADKPVRAFAVPEGVVFTKIDAETGLLPIPESKTTAFVCFKEETAPTQYTKKPGTITETDEFFKADMLPSGS